MARPVQYARVNLPLIRLIAAKRKILLSTIAEELGIPQSIVTIRIKETYFLFCNRMLLL